MGNDLRDALRYNYEAPIYHYCNTTSSTAVDSIYDIFRTQIEQLKNLGVDTVYDADYGNIKFIYDEDYDDECTREELLEFIQS